MKSPSMVLKHAWYIFESTCFRHNKWPESQNTAQNTTGICMKDSKAERAFSDISEELNL